MAAQAVREGMGLRQAATTFKVPRTTLGERVTGKRRHKLGRPPVLSEKVIAERAKVCCI